VAAVPAEHDPRVIAERPFWRRLFGALLVAYGIFGLVLVIGGTALIIPSIGRLDGLAGTIETQRQVLVRSLDATSTFLHDARSGTGNVGASLSATVDSARQTATLTRSLAGAMDQLATASSLNILGQQPFAALGGTFGDVARQAETMGTSLDRTADALARNGTDLSQVTADLASVETELAALRGQVAGLPLGTDDVAGIGRAIDASRLVLGALLLWLAAQAVIAIVAGVVLVRWSPTAVEVIAEPAEEPGLPLEELR
jgi:hypothetical protein